MTLQFIQPLRRAWNRMVEQLFRPFDLSKWIILGFTCWLVRLGESGGGGGGGGGGFSTSPPSGDNNGSFGGEWFDPSSWASWWERLWEGIELTFVVYLVGCIVVAIIAVVLLILWLSSRGHFMFLDNVVRNRAQVVAPWKEYRKEGNSLFLWRLGFIVACVVVMFLVALPGIMTLISAGSGDSGAGIALGLVVLLIPTLLVAVALAYIELFLTDFVAPVMYRQRLKTTAAWRVFLPEMRKHGAELLLYGLFVLALHIAVKMVITIAVLLTCCVSAPIVLLLWFIPVIPTIILLPLHLTYRLFSLEFLGQFGPDFELLPALAAAPATAPPAPPTEPTGGTGD